MFKVDLYYLFKMNSIPLFQNYKKNLCYLFQNKIALKNIYYLNMLDLF